MLQSEGGVLSLHLKVQSGSFQKQKQDSVVAHLSVLVIFSVCCWWYLPVVDSSTGVFAVLDVKHKNGKTQEPHTHAEADAVHCLVAHKHFTVEIRLNFGDRRACSIFTEAWDLQKHHRKSHLHFIKHLSGQHYESLTVYSVKTSHI